MKRPPTFPKIPAAAAALGLVFAVQALASGLSVFPPPETRVRAGGEATLPVTIEGARDVGALQFDMAFRDDILEIVEVASGGGMPPVLLDFHVVWPGLLRVAMAGSEPIDGDVQIDVRIRGLAAGSGDLEIQDALAWELTTGFELLTEARPGRVTVTGGMPMAGLLITLVLGLLMLAGIGLILLLRKGKAGGGQPDCGGATWTPPSPPGPPPPPGGPPAPPAAAPQPPPSSRNWYLGRGGERYGPYDDQQFEAMVREGNVLPDDLVWNETMAEWLRADAVKGLLSGS